MFFTCLQWTDVHIPLCFQRSWLQLSLKTQKEVNTWCLSGENIHCVGCLWKAVSKFNLFCCVFFNKTDFFLKKRLHFQHQSFLCTSTVLLLGKLFQAQKETILIWYRKKRPQVSSEQNICPSWVKHRFRSLFCLTWFSSLPDECLDHTTEKRVGRCLFLLLFWERSTKLSLLFPS